MEDKLCSKRKFKSKRLAKIESLYDNRLQPYKCKDCNSYHLTTKLKHKIWLNGKLVKL
jgi:hypothetical protein